jgi:pimeloyl-ACP methyl ester carboxylesterase
MMPISIPEDRYIKIGTVNTRYWVAGEKGTPVILVHGLGGFIENWGNNIGPLAENHRVYALDLKGFGRADKTPVLRDLDELITFIGDFMNAMNIDKASLIGNSLGGGLALSFAIQFPQRVNKLVLVDNAGMGKEVISSFKIISLPLVGEILARPSLKGTTRLLKSIIFDASLVTDEVVKKAFIINTLPGAKRALLTTARAGIDIRGQRAKLTRQTLEGAAKIAVPTLIIWGRQDRIIPVAHAQIAVKTIPGSRLQIFDSCGHMPMWEKPDEFNKLVMDFLAG